MKNNKYISATVGFVMIVGTAPPVLAMPAAVCDPALITIQVLADTLDFAGTTPCAVASAVVLNAQTGVKTIVSCPEVFAGVSQLGSIRVAGNQTNPFGADKLVRVTIDSVTENISSGANSMSVGTFRLFPCNCVSTTQAGNATVDYTIGATMNVGGSQPAGVYGGTFSVTAECD